MGLLLHGFSRLRGILGVFQVQAMGAYSSSNPSNDLPTWLPVKQEMTRSPGLATSLS